MLITGANTGIGYETAVDLCQQGFTVYIACRSLEKANDTEKRVNAASKTRNAIGLTTVLELSSLASVRTFCEEFKKQVTSLNVLGKGLIRTCLLFFSSFLYIFFCSSCVLSSFIWLVR